MQLTASLIDDVCAMAQIAGEKILKFYNEGFTVTTKADNSPLSSADIAAHDFLVSSLSPLAPEIPVISEESNLEMAHQLIGSKRFWLVDPLDGTKEFIKRTNEFTVNIALIEGARPVFGVVHAPALGMTYYAAEDFGAYKIIRGEKPVAIASRRAKPESLSVIASKDHAGPIVELMLSRMPAATRRSMGSSLKFCLIAEGDADIYLRDQPTMEWDTAAAQCVVQVAGGTVRTLDGLELNYAKSDLKNPSFIVVGDPQFEWACRIARD